MMTGISPIGSSTPPICAAAEMWTRFPTCAHDPTSACESIIVSSSMNAPALINIGGMQVARDEKGGRALVALTVDSAIPTDVVHAIASEIEAEVRVVDLDG